MKIIMFYEKSKFITKCCCCFFCIVSPVCLLLFFFFSGVFWFFLFFAGCFCYFLLFSGFLWLFLFLFWPRGGLNKALGVPKGLIIPILQSFHLSHYKNDEHHG